VLHTAGHAAETGTGIAKKTATATAGIARAEGAAAGSDAGRAAAAGTGVGNALMTMTGTGGAREAAGKEVAGSKAGERLWLVILLTRTERGDWCFMGVKIAPVAVAGVQLRINSHRSRSHHLLLLLQQHWLQLLTQS
jgi:hypothetical protein